MWVSGGRWAAGLARGWGFSIYISWFHSINTVQKHAATTRPSRANHVPNNLVSTKFAKSARSKRLTQWPGRCVRPRQHYFALLLATHYGCSRKILQSQIALAWIATSCSLNHEWLLSEICVPQLATAITSSNNLRLLLLAQTTCYCYYLLKLLVFFLIYSLNVYCNITVVKT